MRMVSPVPMVLLLCGLLFVSPMATAVPPKKVAALGRFEPRGGVIAIAAPPGERIEQLPVAVGSVVAANADLAILSGHKARLLQRELARKQLEEARDRAAANLAAACALHAEATLGVEAADADDVERIGQKARLEAALLSLETARAELDRLAGLEPRLVPAQSMERKRLLVRQAQIDAETQRALLERMEAAAGLRRRSAEAKLRSAASNVDLAESSTHLESLETGVEVAELTLELSRVRAPGPGRVIDIVSRVGELTGLRPILRLADTDHMQVVAEVYETDIRQVTMGQRVEVTAEALPNQKLTGHVVAIGSMIGANEVQALGVPPTAEQRIVKVWIDLDDSTVAAKLIHLQVEVEFLPDGAAGGPKGS